MPREDLRHTASVSPSPGVVSRPRPLWWAFSPCAYRPRRSDIFARHDMKRMNVSNKKCPVVVLVSSITSSQVLRVDAAPRWCLVVCFQRIWFSVLVADHQTFPILPPCVVSFWGSASLKHWFQDWPTPKSTPSPTSAPGGITIVSGYSAAQASSSLGWEYGWCLPLLVHPTFCVVSFSGLSVCPTVAWTFTNASKDMSRNYACTMTIVGCA